MPNKQVIRARVIRLIQTKAPVFRRNLEKAFAGSTRGLAKQVISELLSENYIIVVGTGRRGNPEKIVLSAGWPAAKCPMCGSTKHETE